MDKHFKRGCEFLQAQKYAKAARQFELQLEAFAFKECYLNLGMCYKHLNQHELAIKHFALSTSHHTKFFDGTSGEYALGLHNLGCSAYALGSDCTANAFYALALQADPTRANSIFSSSLPLLRQLCSERDVDVVDAWNRYSYRFQTQNPIKVSQAVPMWDQCKHHRRVIVLREQGFGDALQFARYLPQLYNYFDEVVLESFGSLDVLFTDYKIYKDVQDANAQVSIPIGSLAQKFGVDRSGTWLKNRYVPSRLSSKLNVIVENTGSPLNTNDHNRSCGVELFDALRLSDVQLYSAKPGAQTQPGVINLNPQSWIETCEYLLGADLVVTVDTSLAHLAGSLGVPCWLLQPLYETDWRWGDETMGTKNVWYQTVKVVRNPHNWAAVFEVVKQDLKRLLMENNYKKINRQLHTMLETMNC